MSLDGLAPLRDVIRRHDIGARKALGQNFLLDLNLTAKVARAAEPLAAHTIVEIGPGPGGLTRALLALGARRVIAIERDRRCLSALEEIAAHYPGRLTLIEGDALSSDVRPLLEGDAPARIVANLPYNISTPLLVGWLSQEPWPPWFDMMVLMFQREVAERIAAPPRSDAYGRLSVLAQWRCETKILFDIPPRAFVPAPKVTSTVVRLVPRATPLECARARLEQVTAAAFGQRRKMLRQSLKAACADPLAVLAEAGIAPTRRAEDLDVAQFVALARLIGPRERDGL